MYPHKKEKKKDEKKKKKERKKTTHVTQAVFVCIGVAANLYAVGHNRVENVF